MRFLPKALPLVIVVMVAPIVALLAQQIMHRLPKPKPPAVTTPAPDPEEQWACGFGTRRDRNGEHCQCPAMVAEVIAEHIDHCKDLTNEKAYEACMNNASNYCDIVKNADLKHPVHSCNRSCSTKSICRCADGPACHLPPLPHPDDEGDQQ